ncbi:MAG: TspO/MBR family protein [Alphaproteobacteria bacterium ADurb.Bin438]|nr:MAG: TspO/MBR family protein [Alphaproteobacteria bacterium ADurb.Bin438]
MRNQKKYIFYVIILMCIAVTLFTSYYIHRGLHSHWYVRLYVSKLMPSNNNFVFLWIISLCLSSCSYLIINEEKQNILFELGETLYITLLFLCLIWPLGFFFLKSAVIGILILSLLLLTTFITSAVFFKISNSTLILMSGYIVILTFIFHTNLYIVLRTFNVIIR